MRTDEQMAAAISENLKEKWGWEKTIPFKWVAAVEFLDPDGKSYFQMVLSDGLRTWEARGLLGEAVALFDSHETASRVTSLLDDSEDDDDA